MTPEQLKASILQYAIQGKLVEQRPEEGTAEELYQQIQKEKQKLIKEGKTKKEKPLAEITDEEVPFDIPESWKWDRLGNVLVIERGGSPRPIKDYLTNEERGINWIKIGDTDKGGKYINSTNEKIIPEGMKKSRYVKKGDFLLSNSMSFGRPYILNIDGCIHDGWLVLKQPVVVFDKDYLYYLLSSPMVYNQFCGRVAGAVVNNLNSDKVALTVVPIPPIEEQHRIASKIEELLPYVDRYAEAYEKLERFNAKFPEDMKKSILQYAIQGKLVEQRPEEGTAEELYQQIQKEKQKLIKEGKIKKEKPLPEITEDEIPFEIPESWKWVRLMELCKSINDGDHQPPPQTSEGYPFVVISNVSNGRLELERTRYVDGKYFNSLSKERIAEKGDLLYTVTGSYGIVIKVDTDKQFCFQRHIALLKVLVDRDYLYYVLQSPYIKSMCDTYATGTAQRTVGLSVLRNILIPFPPSEEQRRVVAKIEKLLLYCKQLEIQK